MVAGLDEHPGTVGMDPPSKTGQAVDHPVVGKGRLVPGRGPVGPRDRRGLQDQQAGAPGGPFLVMGHCGFGNQALVGAVVLVHGRHDDPVPDLDGADPAGGQEVGVAIGH